MKGKKWGEKLYKMYIASDKIKQIAGFHYDFHATETGVYGYKLYWYEAHKTFLCVFTRNEKKNEKNQARIVQLNITYESSFSQAHFYINKNRNVLPDKIVDFFLTIL